MFVCWHPPTGVTYYLFLHVCSLLLLFYTYRETDITSLLIGISPALTGQIEELTLSFVSINSGCVEVLIHSLTSPYSHLLKMELNECTISSSDYCHLTTAIPTSNLIHFATHRLGTDVSFAKGLARALKQSKTLEQVEVMWENPMNNEVAQILVEAMNHSSVKKLKIGQINKDAILQCSYPTDKVEIKNTLYWIRSIFNLSFLFSKSLVMYFPPQVIHSFKPKV